MRVTDKFTFFYGGEFSQWYNRKMIIDNIEFNCCEQYMMWKKAITFNDMDSASKIIESNNPKEQKELGRFVKNFNANIWDSVKHEIVFTANYNKFTQHADLKKLLLSTQNTILVEASPYDKVWGVGLSECDDNILNPSNWKGQNLLGYILTNIRNKIQDNETK